LQHGGGAMLLEFEQDDLRHPHPDRGSRVMIEIRANSIRRVSIIWLHQVRDWSKLSELSNRLIRCT